MSQQTILQDQQNATNKIISNFFSGFRTNDFGERWFSPRFCKRQVPREVAEIRDSFICFFETKKWYAGGSIPDELLFTQENFHLANNIPLEEALKIAEISIEEAAENGTALTKYEPNIHTKLTLEIIRECEKRRVQFYHIGGVLLLYLKLCENVVLL